MLEHMLIIESIIRVYFIVLKFQTNLLEPRIPASHCILLPKNSKEQVLY